MEYQCDVCDSHDTNVKLLTTTVFVKDKIVKISKERRFCRNCGCLVYDSVLDNEYIKEGLRLYNEKYAFSKEDIITTEESEWEDIETSNFDSDYPLKEIGQVVNQLIRNQKYLKEKLEEK